MKYKFIKDNQHPLGVRRIGARDNIVCPICKKEFYPKDRDRKYCSRQCYFQMKRNRGDRVVWTDEMRKKMSVKYTGDGNPSFGRPSSLKGKKRPNFSGKKHPNYRGGWIQNGYKMMSVGGKNVQEHRYIMERHIGRKLDSFNEVVHHIDGDRLNNDIDNLMVMTRAEHINYHRNDLQSCNT